jgi:outer membrane protein
MTSKFQVLATALVAALGAGAVQAQDAIVKFGVTRYDTHSRTNGVTGIGVPAGADASTGDATTVIAVYERMLQPNFGIELVLGVPPKITAKATGSVPFLGEVLSARNAAPTLLANYHFGATGDRWRPYLGVGLNYTRFVGIKSKLATDVRMSDSVGLAAQAGVDYAIDKQWGLFASVAALKVKSDLVAVGTTVLQTTIDFRPLVYSAGVSYRF